MSANCWFCVPLLLLVTQTVAQPGKKKDSPENVKDPGLRRELLQRKDREQVLRFEIIKFYNKKGITPGAPITDPKVQAEFKALQEKLNKVDDDNRKWLQGVIDKHGWPGKSLVGKNAAGAAWLLVQHADADRPFQKRCLALMKGLPRGEVELPSIAYLTDRVLVGEKKKQLYGTQLQPNAKGELIPQPIEDESRVDQRRREMGMEPLAEYLKVANKVLTRPK
jgi:hypothetical protein